MTVSFGDGAASSYGSDANCRIYGVDLEMAPIVGVISANLSPTHSYRDEGLFSQIVTAYSPASVETTTSAVVISAYNCQAPKLLLLTSEKSFRDPLRIPKRDPIQLTVHNTIECDDISNAKLWTIFEVDQNTGDELDEIDLSEVRSRTGSVLVIKSGNLDYGLYKVSYRMVMLANQWFSAEVSTHIKMVRSDLIVRLTPGLDISITRGWKTTIALDAEGYSRDPDDPDESQVGNRYDYDFLIDVHCRSTHT